LESENPARAAVNEFFRADVRMKIRARARFGADQRSECKRSSSSVYFRTSAQVLAPQRGIPESPQHLARVLVRLGSSRVTHRRLILVHPPPRRERPARMRHGNRARRLRAKIVRRPSASTFVPIRIELFVPIRIELVVYRRWSGPRANWQWIRGNMSDSAEVQGVTQ
jgi:hypothetical protein